MSFREKTAWVTLITILILSLLYFLHVPWSLRPPASPALAHGLLILVAVFLAIKVVAFVALYLQSPKDARTPKDERERLIDLKATRLSAWTYLVGSFAAVSTIHVGANQLAVAYGVLLAFAVAETVSHAARIVYYRRGV